MNSTVATLATLWQSSASMKDVLMKRDFSMQHFWTCIQLLSTLAGRERESYSAMTERDLGDLESGEGGAAGFDEKWRGGFPVVFLRSSCASLSLKVWVLCQTGPSHTRYTHTHRPINSVILFVLVSQLNSIAVLSPIVSAFNTKHVDGYIKLGKQPSVCVSIVRPYDIKCAVCIHFTSTILLLLNFLFQNNAPSAICWIQVMTIATLWYGWVWSGELVTIATLWYGWVWSGELMTIATLWYGWVWSGDLVTIATLWYDWVWSGDYSNTMVWLGLVRWL